MFSGEGEVQARRKTLTVLQDESRKISDAARELVVSCIALLKRDSKGLQQSVEKIRKIEEDVEALRRDLAREIAELGTMIMNREDLLRAAYSIEDVAGHLSGIGFRFLQVKKQTLKGPLGRDLKDLVEATSEAVAKLNETVRALAFNPGTVMDHATEVQKVERQVDEKYRTVTATLLKKVKNVRDLVVLKDIIERIEDTADRCLDAADSITILSLGM